MQPSAFVLAVLLMGQVAFAASIETFTGDIYTGKVELDFGGVVLRPEKGPISKMDLSTIYRVHFSASVWPEEFKPGLVLRNGVRLTGDWGPFHDPVIKYPKRKLTFPAEEIAWIVYTTFPDELAAGVPGGQTGALLPKGDFFAGAIRGADAEEAKIFNPIFGPRTFQADDLHALVLRDTHVPAAQYEVRTTDGSLFAADYLAPDSNGVTIKHTLYDNLVLSSGEVIEIRAGANRCRPLTTFGELHAEPPDGLQILPERGFTLDVRSVASCVVPAGFTELVVKVAADDTTPPGQRLVFTISADGRPLARSSALAAGDPAQNLRASLTGARSLVLHVEAAGGAAADLRGHWVQALFLRR